MKIKITSILCLIAGFVCGKNHVLPVDTLRESLQITELVGESLTPFPNQTQFSIALIRNGEVEFYGFKKEGEEVIPVDNKQCVFETGSLSKIFTSTLLAGFVLDGEIALDDNINDYIDVPLKDNAEISFLELANHTSGLPRLPADFFALPLIEPENPYLNYNDTYLEDYLINKLEVSEERKYDYSNLGTGLLGYALSKHSKKGYEALLHERIFSKYGMNHSSSQRKNVQGLLVPGLDSFGNCTSNWDFTALAGAGGILSSVEDLSHFALAQFDDSNRELALTRKPTYTSHEQMSMGLGWHILTPPEGRKLYWHNGGTGGYSSSIFLDISGKNGVILLTNVSAFHPGSGNVEKTAVELLHKFTGF